MIQTTTATTATTVTNDHMESCRLLDAPQRLHLVEDEKLLSRPSYEESHVPFPQQRSVITLEFQRSAIEHNNYAIICLKQGNYQKAFQLFKRALTQSRQSMAEAPLCRRDGETPPVSLDSFVPDVPVREVMNEDKPFLCDNLVSISQLVGSSYHACVVVSALLTYNFALANHLLGLLVMSNNNNCDNTSPTAAASYLQAAATFYQLACSMQRAEGFADNTLFASTIFNNLGLVHWQLGNPREADQWFECLWRIIRSSPNVSPSSTSSLQGRFLRNVSLWFSQSSTAPAA